MVIIDTIKGDLLDAKETYICQQCNCNTIKSHGLSKSISDRYSWANPYNIRPKKSNNSTTDPDEPGTIIELEHPYEPNKFPIFLCFMGQWLPGKPYVFKKYYPNTYNDTYENRKQWFQNCLDILDENKYNKVAVPYMIGCGLAGGKWTEYKKMLEDCHTKIVIYKLS